MEGGRTSEGGDASTGTRTAPGTAPVWPRAQRRAALAVVAAATAAVAAAAVILPPHARPAAAPAPAHQALAAWIVAETDHAAAVDAPADIRAELVADGVTADRMGGGPAALQVTRGADGPGRALARFGDGADILSVTQPGATDTGAPARTALGRQLATNSAVDAPAAVRDLLSSGRVDPRALIVLVGLTALGPVHILDMPAVAGEDPGMPRHRLVLSGVEPAGLAWVQAQRPPFAPRIDPAGGRTTLSWTVPAPPGMLGA